MGQSGTVPTCKPCKGSDPKGAVARDQQAVRTFGELLAGRWLPPRDVNAIEAKQAEFRAEP